MSSSTSYAHTTLVVGATGETGKHVVHQLLQNENHRVKVLVRSQQKMVQLLRDLGSNYNITNNLEIIEVPTFQELSQDDLTRHVAGCDSVVSCLGHNLTVKAIWGRKDRGLVVKAATRLSKAIQANNNPAKLIFMGSDGVAHPAGTDNVRSLGDRIILSILRTLVPPQSDNEAAAKTLFDLGTKSGLEWCVVRPTDLINEDDITEYTLYDKPPGGLFGDGVASRINVAAFMVDLILAKDTWAKYKYQMPVLHNKDAAAKKTKKEDTKGSSLS